MSYAWIKILLIPQCYVTSNLYCNQCEDDWIIIVANGRSGSTTIVDMLNELPGVYVAGERAARSERDIVDALFDYYEAATDRNKRSGPFQTFAKVEELPVLCEIQRAIKVALGPIPARTQTLGFKTLHAAGSNQRLERLRRLFPCARFVHNYRQDVHAEFHSPQSFFRRNGIDEQGLQRRTDLLADPRHAHFDLPLETFGVPLFNDLRRFVGDERCTFVGVKHSSNYNFKTDTNHSVATCDRQRGFPSVFQDSSPIRNYVARVFSTTTELFDIFGECKSPSKIRRPVAGELVRIARSPA
jgi:hypothetical protein